MKVNESPMFKSAKSNKISEDIVEQIRRAILDGFLNPGDRLPPEKELVGDFKVSKATLREGLRSLEALGFLEIRKGALGGAFVTEVDRKKAGEFLSNFFHFKNVSLRDISEVRILVESYIASKAAKSISEEQLSELKELNDEFDKQLQLDLPPEYYNSQIQFHRILGDAVANPILVLIVDFVCNILIGAKEILRPRKGFYMKVLIAHKQIYQSLLERNSERAREAMIEHIREEEEELFDIQTRKPLQALDLRQALVRNLLRNRKFDRKIKGSHPETYKRQMTKS